MEEGIARGGIHAAAVFDFDYVPLPGTDPVQYETRFCAFAAEHIRPILDRTKNADPRHIAGAATDVNGYLPTHISERPQPQSPDPEWNAKYCRTRRNFLDEATQRAVESEQEAMPVTY